jgi:O-methyltransferase
MPVPGNIANSISQIIERHQLISDQMDQERLALILKRLDQALEHHIPGDIVEFGCYLGTTSLFIARLLAVAATTRRFHVYDSFEGLPGKTIEDASVAGSNFRAGELKASKRQLVRNFKHAHLKPPLIHKAWFNELKSKDLPNQIAFAFIDSDFYRSIYGSLEIVWPRLSSGGAVIVDDYNRSSLPGATRAVNDFFTVSNVRIQHQSNLAIITKP